MLKLENISVSYGNRQVLQDINMHIDSKEIILLLGANGSGKSTLLKAIYGLVPKLLTTGSNPPVISFRNENITAAFPSQLLGMQLMYIPQKDNLFNDLSVHENLEMAGAVLDTATRKDRIRNIFAQFEKLKNIRNTPAMKISGGEKQLLAFAMTYLHEPLLVMLDEPFAGLNSMNVELLSNRIRMHNRKGMAFLIVEHKITESLHLADRVLVLKEGKTLYEFKKEAGKFDIDSINVLFT